MEDPILWAFHFPIIFIIDIGNQFTLKIALRGEGDSIFNKNSGGRCQQRAELIPCGEANALPVDDNTDGGVILHVAMCSRQGLGRW